MGHDDMNRTDRRKFLQAGVVATAAAASIAPGLSAQQAPKAETELPKRKLGKTGAMVTILEQAQGRRRTETSLRVLSPTASACSIPPRSTAPSRSSRLGSRSPPRFASRSSLSPRTCRGPRKIF